MHEFDNAMQFMGRGDYRGAEQILLDIKAKDERNFDAIHMLGVVCMELKKLESSEEFFKIALSIDPRYPPLYSNFGIFLSRTKRPHEAIEKFTIAIRLAPNFAPFYSERGNALSTIGKLDDAIIDHNYAISLGPPHFGFYNNRGHTLQDKRQFIEALSDFDQAVKLNQNYADAHHGRGNVLFVLKRYDEAILAYDRALALKPDLAAAESARLLCKMYLCDWNNFDTECGHLFSSIKEGIVTQPFVATAISSSPDALFLCARSFSKERFPASDKPIWHDEKYAHDRIRIAYVSADFHNHVVSYLFAGAFERHDRRRFETIAISLSPDNPSEMLTRLKNSFDRFINVSAQSDVDVAKLLRTLEVDIAVDLMGYTENSRTAIFANRPVPIQVNYLGYPGTIGADYIDYLIADQILIPESHQQYYAEKIVYLPNSYQVNDAKRLISDKHFSRNELGLPQSGFVFCCFNNNYKLTPDVFDCWMRILREVGDSVLWLREDNASAASNLRKAAAARGVNAERLVFAKRIPSLPNHLARHRLADLFLDTLPFNAHTTASDALWAGLPVLTQIGETFAGRVAASLLAAIGLPELITSTPLAYEQLAIELATNPEKLIAIRRKLANNRLTTSLFDTELFTRHLEGAYIAMYERYQTGLPVDQIYVPQ